MPEGDAVWRTARLLDAALAGRVLTRSDFRVPRFATTDLTGRTVTETVSSGKHLLTRVDGGLTVHTHLRMDGSWRIRPTSDYLPSDHRIRLVLGNDSRQALGYQLGVVEVLPTGSEARVVGHLGPDLLGPGWDAAEAVRRLQADPDRPVGEALLDQRNLAGIGNIYKTEVLFLRGLDPWRPVGGIDDMEALVELARKLLEANKDRAGQITTGNPARGQETWVYGRPGRPCRRCGTPVRTARHSGQRADPEDRVTFWCPRCQTLRIPRNEHGRALPVPPRWHLRCARGLAAAACAHAHRTARRHPPGQPAAPRPVGCGSSPGRPPRPPWTPPPHAATGEGTARTHGPLASSARTPAVFRV
ncbi:MAG TPA: DNA-formamidopyrimidine glycosylase family protein [Streptosporangiaceae bacterium]|nr:DNA-formamidopyrimidine glycosylase family protein [Streptosporangiaceae bacterium]